MFSSIPKQHLLGNRNGFFLSNGGIEFSLALMTASIAVALQGAGKLSLDHLILKKVSAR